MVPATLPRATMLPVDSPALRFTSAWFDATERFNSACWMALIVPRSSASLLAELRQFAEWIDRSGFGRDCFASSGQFNLLDCIWHSHDGEHRPTVESVIEYMDIRGWAGPDVGVGGGDLLAELIAKLEIESSAAGLLNYARMMVESRNRDRLASRMRNNYRRILDPQISIEEIVTEYAEHLTQWRGHEQNHG